MIISVIPAMEFSSRLHVSVTGTVPNQGRYGPLLIAHLTDIYNNPQTLSLRELFFRFFVSHVESETKSRKSVCSRRLTNALCHI